MRMLLRAVFRALFLDVPFLIDSVWRRLDFRFNGEYRYRCLGVPGNTGGGTLEQRPPWQRSMFWFFALTVVFVAYGPVWDGLCTVFVPPLASWALGLAGVALAAVALRLLSVMTAGGKRRLASRFNSPELRTENPRLLRWRRHVAALVLTVLMLIVFVLLALAAGWLLARAVASPPACHWVEGYATPSAWRLAACLGAILLFALACRLIQSTRGLVFIQFVLLVLVAWLTTVVLIPAGSTPPHGKEATGLPYRHLFAFVAPALCFVVCLAPFLARVKLSAKIPFAEQRWILRGTVLALLLLAVVLGLRVAQIEPMAGAVDAAPLVVVGAIVLLSYALTWPLELLGVAPATRQFFAERLTQRELFEARGTDPQLTFERVAYALVHGILYRPLQLVLPSALLAFVARPSWLLWLVALGFVFSVLMLAWGSIANRWQQMVLIVERWFLSGTSLPVSLFVIVVAALRVAQIDYVTTIMDSAPFGVLFGGVVMSYVLAWLIEYWLNRALGVEVLRMLGSTDDRAALPYPPTPPVRIEPDPEVLVELPGRYVMAHAIGRFLLVGTLSNNRTEPAFHSYPLVGFLSKLAGREDRHVAEIARHANLYFYLCNALLLMVVAGFVAFAALHGRPLAVEPVVETTRTAPGHGLKNLAARLVAPANETPRPAIVVVASGGGTRAAIYTAHVLEGLHRLGVDGDIVLMSGVSGGGAALAYFAANYAALTDTTQDKAAQAEAWQKYKAVVGDKFIQDVLEGATEWRVFGATPLSTLLAESFERRLPPAVRSFGDLAAAPPLVLNTTMVGHPAEESDILQKTLDAVGGEGDARCREEERPFTLMKGGRLIFTDLDTASTTAYPPRASAVPEVRLPYRIVQDLQVPVAQAAALHANFPPVFPNARVVVRDDATGPCPRRSYFVTDGGAEENLGLVSALYAVRSALAQIAQRCPAAGAAANAAATDAATQVRASAAASAPAGAATKAPANAPATAITNAADMATNAQGSAATPPACSLRPLHFVLAEASATGYDFTQDRGLGAAIGGAKERMTGGLTEELIASIRRSYAQLAGARGAVSAASGSADAGPVQFHYLALPLLFRARGGFGTHWMQAEDIKVVDPRSRTAPQAFPAAFGFGRSAVTLSKDEVATLWAALHRPDREFCSAKTLAQLQATKHAKAGTKIVHEWICLDQSGKPGARDLHIIEWQKLVAALGGAAPGKGPPSPSPGTKGDVVGTAPVPALEGTR